MHSFKNIVFIYFLFGLNTAYSQTNNIPLKVKVISRGDAFILLRNKKPYFIKGAGGTSYTDRLAKYGGNLIRTCDTRNGDEVLNKANAIGLTVTMGFM